MDFNDAMQHYISEVGSRAMVEDVRKPIVSRSILTAVGWLLYDEGGSFIALVLDEPLDGVGQVFPAIAMPVEEMHSMKEADVWKDAVG